MTSKPFSWSTTGDEVVQAFADRVKGRTCRSTTALSQNRTNIPKQNNSPHHRRERKLHRSRDGHHAGPPRVPSPDHPPRPLAIQDRPGHRHDQGPEPRSEGEICAPGSVQPFLRARRGGPDPVGPRGREDRRPHQLRRRHGLSVHGGPRVQRQARETARAAVRHEPRRAFPLHESAAGEGAQGGSGGEDRECLEQWTSVGRDQVG